ncbi:zinc ribbon-containing protein [Williamsia herbipolensis]|uniref:Zinc ribbon-containing protein n=1 Tax=Williamsia herbipolensis TaxID=1603258 RepID=A0AAU4JZW2_9NOCA|nr:hypothetical protein [Williamsia herbipolensis]
MKDTDNVIQLRPDTHDGLTCEKCGEAWFRAVVTFDRAGRINGWASMATCNECGHTQFIDTDPTAHPHEGT